MFVLFFTSHTGFHTHWKPLHCRYAILAVHGSTCIVWACAVILKTTLLVVFNIGLQQIVRWTLLITDKDFLSHELYIKIYLGYSLILCSVIARFLTDLGRRSKRGSVQAVCTNHRKYIEIIRFHTNYVVLTNIQERKEYFEYVWLNLKT